MFLVLDVKPQRRGTVVLVSSAIHWPNTVI